MKNLRVSMLLVAILWAHCALSGLTATAGVVLQDSTFNEADWSIVIFYDNTPGSNAAVTGSQILTGGNPDEFRETIQSYAFGQMAAAHFRSGAMYDPSVSGAISTVDYSFEANVFDYGTSLAVGYGIVLLQNGEYYQGQEAILTDNIWTSVAMTQLRADDFVGTNAGDHPDFSAAGSLIQFGYYTANGTAGVRTQTDSGIDNLSVTLNIGEVAGGSACDLNLDGAVDAADAGIMFGAWGISPLDTPSDKNKDGFVDAADAGLLFADWTGDSVLVSLPEPHSLLPAVSGLAALLRRRNAFRPLRAPRGDSA